MLLTYVSLQLWRCVSFLVLGGNSFWCYIEYVLSVQYTCVVVSVFWLWRKIVLRQEIVLKMRTPFDFLWANSTKKSYWVTLLWSTSQCVYFVKPKTLLLCIFLSCIFLLYHTDPQVEVQIRILLKDKYGKSCQNANTGNHTMISCTQFLRKNLIGFLKFTVTTRQPRYVSHEIRTFYSAYLFLAFYESTALQSQLFLKNIENFLCK